jgi:DNA polymerase-3 subunit gamma/tau
MVFYRKYRPRTIDELDSTAVREKLYSVLRDPEKIPHAFLFTGPKGLGKTSTARIIAKVVNCAAPKTKRGASGIEPCNTCEQCVAITNGTNMDVLEIDAASNRGIDEIRELKEKIKLAPIAARKKIYIIDEVHMLTTEAFNALLKTLEEPPAHALFMLCTTEPQKIPATILSRTFHMTFKKATPEELTRSLQRIVKAEKIEVSGAALQKIAALSDGGFRDGVKMLEEVHALANGEKITPELIEQKYRITDSNARTDTFIKLLSERRTGETLTLINTITGEGSDIRFVLEQVVTMLHTELLREAGVSQAGEKAGSGLGFTELREILLLLTQALSDMKYAVLPQLPFELAVIEWGERAQNTTEPNTEQLGSKIQRSAQSGSVASSDDITGKTRYTKSTDDSVSVSTLRKQVGNMHKIKAMYGEKDEKKEKAPAGAPADVSVLNFSAQGDITPEWLQAFWRAIIQEIKQHNHTLAGVLRGCKIKSFDRKHLIIETAYTFHQEKLDNAKTKAALEQICRSLTGNPVAVTVELKSA